MAEFFGRQRPAASRRDASRPSRSGTDQGIQALGWLITQYQRLTQIVATDLHDDPEPEGPTAPARAAELRLQLIRLSRQLVDRLLAHRSQLCHDTLRHGATIEDIARALDTPVEVVQAQLRHRIDQQRDRGELDVHTWLLLHRHVRARDHQPRRD
jgi:hypothetical protein